jgi:hypothetical protein
MKVGKKSCNQKALLPASFLLGLLFDPADGTNAFPRKFGKFLPFYTASPPQDTVLVRHECGTLRSNEGYRSNYISFQSYPKKRKIHKAV